MHYKELNQTLGNVDIYLLDQILKGRFENKNRILDAGCGEGRNLTYFNNNGHDIYGIDTDPMAIKMLQMMFKVIPKDHFLAGNLEALPWKDQFFDAIICSAVLHFAKDKASFKKMMLELTRVLRPRGVLFIRMASTIGLPFPKDPNFSFLISKEDIYEVEKEMGLVNVESIKSVIVEDKRSMLVWVLEKS
ncbi:class I SAM-dependent methyltransferase [Fulvivirga sediminis]|uniref:Class I SAM-dependent methyltransferase n=1 Tax=Fulvivirga sediminis TaxID=2803949 RepID=A0A937F7J2_9BACT|nr:class I SAM-dependent methyltransferase [Fulvivirga sediminis]MBL3657872.1 class I SAM-dependent methyltransferase [Fulvivirga sediminis]